MSKNNRPFVSILSIASIVLFLLSACGKAPEPQAVILSSGPTGTLYELPVDQVKDKEVPAVAGKDVDDVVAVVTVPPSDKPTEVIVHKRPKGVLKKAKEAFTGTSGSPDYAVTSDNGGVKAETTKETGLWPWLAGLAAIAGGLFAARTWLSRFGWIVKIINFLKGLIGL